MVCCPEDFELWNRWMAHGIKIGKVPEVILDWHDPPNRLSRTHQNYAQESFSKVKARYFAIWFHAQFKQQKPDIYVFGFGKIVKKKTRFLTEEGLKIHSFVDVIDRPKSGCIHYLRLPEIKNKFVLSYVADRHGKEKIKDYLIKIEMVEGKDFYIME